MADRYKVDQRAALFGSRARAGASTIGRGNDRADVDGHSQREALEQQNNDRLAELEAKVSQLKDVTRGISRETKDSLGLLEGLGLNFDKANTLMKATVGQLQHMVQRKNGRTGLLVGMFVTLFLVLYFLSAMRSWGADPPEESHRSWPNASGPKSLVGNP
mmetsp:Transcript_90162/g.176533  ORF Transcript_90162/g.176533 Transcript_90162/m.176533 type:complete len:160 (-) Transcript_90162:29-508(-)|eukprot:CAMPEP_0170213390 /NCGR_PEP_ID=MMETSP0116_2-20130129/6319_1 /TAXON_ID=400756 /ORGANISM="Durinskia baltica, Strain CSIRO CS-38" /LENGTH=159 /DNA_ID=CAMNT_0010463941 /DNA_START=115 /DNA_END=594 /DNA_ORIENTATION=+